MQARQNDRIEAHTFYVAHCAECEESADGDGQEYCSSQEEAVEYVEHDHEWRRVDGRLLCPACWEGEEL